MKSKSSRWPFRIGFKPAGHWIMVLFVTIISLFAGPLLAEDLGHDAESAVDHPVAIEHTEVHLTPDAPTIFMLGPVPVTNSMITGWLAAGLIILGSIRFRQQVRADCHTLFTGTVEMLVIGLDSFLADIMGAKLAKSTFWLLGSFFIFILFSNWLGLFPGVGSIGWGHETSHMMKITLPLFRGVNADLNTTLALGALFFFFWLIWAWKTNGPVGIIKHIFGFQGDVKGVMYVVMSIVFLAVGFLELVSIAIRPFSLALRLYGNIFAGEVMLETMLHKVPFLGWLLPIPFYLMEVLVGLIQALVFMLLSAVFVMLMCSHEEKEGHPIKDSDAS